MISKETQRKIDEITPKLKLVNCIGASLQFLTYLTTDKKELAFWKEKGVTLEKGTDWGQDEINEVISNKSYYLRSVDDIDAYIKR